MELLDVRFNPSMTTLFVTTTAGKFTAQQWTLAGSPDCGKWHVYSEGVKRIATVAHLIEVIPAIMGQAA